MGAPERSDVSGGPVGEAAEQTHAPAPGGGSRATLYVIPGSHACRTATLMLDCKGVDYRTVELPTGAHPWIVRVLGFAGHAKPIRKVDGATPRMLAMLDRGGTVPALRIDGRRVQTNREIARHLDRTRPYPPLLPSDRQLREAVEEAERWGDEVLQMSARRLVLAASADGVDGLRNRGAAGPLGALLAGNTPMRVFASRTASVVFRADRTAEATVLAELPAMLDRIDAWIAAGVLDGEELNVADFTIAPSLALMSYREDARAQLLARPAGHLMGRLVPEPA